MEHNKRNSLWTHFILQYLCLNWSQVYNVSQLQFHIDIRGPMGLHADSSVQKSACRKWFKPENLGYQQYFIPIFSNNTRMLNVKNRLFLIAFQVWVIFGHVNENFQGGERRYRALTTYSACSVQLWRHISKQSLFGARAPPENKKWILINTNGGEACVLSKQRSWSYYRSVELQAPSRQLHTQLCSYSCHDMCL